MAKDPASELGRLDSEPKFSPSEEELLSILQMVIGMSLGPIPGDDEQTRQAKLDAASRAVLVALRGAGIVVN